MKRQTPLLGVCLGLQYLFEGSDEAPDVRGLGLFPGRCTRLPPRLKVPHVGWNALSTRRRSLLLHGIRDGTQVYFTHSYAAPITRAAVATTEHGARFASAVEADLVFAQLRGREPLAYEEALSDLVTARGDWTKAARVAKAMRDVARRGDRALPCFANRLEGHARAADGERDVAEALFHLAAEGFSALGAPWEAARSLAAIDDYAAVETAASEFDRLGAVLDAAACRTRLARAS